MTQRFEYFSTLRGLLAFWVLMGHLLLTEYFGSTYSAGFASHTDFGLLGKMTFLRFLSVDLFFIISGYVLTKSYADRFTNTTKSKEIDRFYLQRLIRIWPLHALMVACIGLYEYIGVPHPISSGIGETIFQHWQWTLALNLLLMNSWGIIPVASWNEPAWTLSTMFFLYVMFPNLIIILRRIGTRTIVLGALIVTLILGYSLLRETVLTGGHSDGTGALVRGFIFFSVGILIGRMERLPNARFGVAIFFAAVVVWTYFYPFPVTIFHLLYPYFLIAIIQTPKSILPPKCVHWLGEVSFPLFISHYPTLLLIQHVGGAELAQAAQSGAVAKFCCYGLVIGICIVIAEILRRCDTKIQTFAKSFR